MNPLIETLDLEREFRSGGEIIRALHGVSIAVPEGKLTILKGPSGSGKTTLLNLLGALDRPTRGRVLFEGGDLSSAREAARDAIRRKQMGFVFQAIALVSVMSAFENVDFALRVAGYRARQREKRARECLSLVGLRARMHHRPHELSGGEQQRVAIARAIAHEPKVIFADEPTAELDTHRGLAIMQTFRDLIVRCGITIVMTTHDPGMMDLADRMYSIEDGEVVDER
jgi:putative ABC transport system ATP-binding protein